MVVWSLRPRIEQEGLQQSAPKMEALNRPRHVEPMFDVDQVSSLGSGTALVLSPTRFLEIGRWSEVRCDDWIRQQQHI